MARGTFCLNIDNVDPYRPSADEIDSVSDFGALMVDIDGPCRLADMPCSYRYISFPWLSITDGGILHWFMVLG